MKIRNILMIGTLLITNSLVGNELDKYKKSDIQNITNICLEKNENFLGIEYRQCFNEGLNFLNNIEKKKIQMTKLKKYETQIDSIIYNRCLSVNKNKSQKEFKQCFIKNKIIFNTKVLNKLKNK